MTVESIFRSPDMWLTIVRRFDNIKDPNGDPLVLTEIVNPARKLTVGERQVYNRVQKGEIPAEGSAAAQIWGHIKERLGIEDPCPDPNCDHDGNEPGNKVG